jgi:hypothetical protein
MRVSAKTKASIRRGLKQAKAGKLKSLGSFAKYASKIRFRDIPPEAMWEVARCYDIGNMKHGAETWREPTDWLDVYDALERHKTRWRAGEDWDEDGFHHLAAIIHRAMTLLVYSLDEQYAKYDTRKYKKKGVKHGKG